MTPELERLLEDSWKRNLQQAKDGVHFAVGMVRHCRQEALATDIVTTAHYWRGEEEFWLNSLRAWVNHQRTCRRAFRQGFLL